MPSLTSSCPYQPAQPILPSAFKLDSALWLPPHTPQLERSHENRKGRSKRRQHKSRRKQRYGAYIVQMIGVLCLVLAAFEGFEPLTGVGFTLVIVGFKGGVEKDKTGKKARGGKKDGREKKSRKGESLAGETGRLLEDISNEAAMKEEKLCEGVGDERDETDACDEDWVLVDKLAVSDATTAS